MAKNSAKVSAEFDVPAKLAPQLVEILRGVPAGFPCTIESIVTEEQQPEVLQEQAAETPTASTPKPGFLGRIFHWG